VSEDEEERLYRHYGIEYSRAASDSFLPADAAPSAAPAVSSAASAAATTRAEGLDEGVASGQPGPDASNAAEAMTSRPAEARRLLLPALGLLAALAAITGGMLRSRRRRPQPPPPRRERLAERARAATLALDRRKRRAPVLQTGRRISVAAAQQAAMRAEAAAEQASLLTARAKAARLPRVSGADEIVEPAAAGASRSTKRRANAAAALKSGIGFGPGYLLRSRARRTRIG
jgi:hypothetical protein